MTFFLALVVSAFIFVVEIFGLGWVCRYHRLLLLINSLKVFYGGNLSQVVV